MSYQPNYDTLMQLAAMHREDLLREAENTRRARLARPAKKIHASLASQIRWRLGKALVGAGFWLLSHSNAR